MSERIHIETQLPEGHDERMAARASAYQKGLSLVSESPDMRLRMILGEAYQKYLELVRWVVDEAKRDEDKAPGLLEAMQDYADNPAKLLSGARTPAQQHAVYIQQRLLDHAVGSNYPVEITDGLRSRPLIEHDECTG